MTIAIFDQIIQYILKEIHAIHLNPVGSFEVQENGGVRWGHEELIRG